MIFTCADCGEKIVGDDELDAEIQFDQHVCKGKRDFKLLPDDLFIQLMEREITEREAWEKYDAK